MRKTFLYLIIFSQSVLSSCGPPLPLEKLFPNQSPSPTPSPKPTTKTTTPTTPTTKTVSYSGWGIQFSNAGETVNKLSSVSASLTDQTKSVSRIKYGQNRGLMVGAQGTLILISNNGKTLTEINSPTELNLRDGEITDTSIWVVGKDPTGGESVWVTSNDGVTWTREFNTTEFYYKGDHTGEEVDRLSAIQLVSDTDFVVAGALRDGYQILLKKKGSEWFDSLVEADVLASRFTSISKSSTSLVVTGNEGYVVVSFDNGDSWESRSLEPGLELNKVSCSVDFCFVVGMSGYSALSWDLGLSWEQTDPQNSTEADIYAVSINETPDGPIIYMGDSYGTIYISDNLGLTWVATYMFATDIPILDINMITPTSGWATSGLLTGSSGSLLFQETFSFQSVGLFPQ